MPNGADAIVQVMKDEDVEFLFGIPGTQNLAILDVIRETPSIRFILTRHEQGAGFMCYGYARVSGKPGIVTATEGPGATNLFTPMAAAHKGNVPVIAISGSPDRPKLELEASQDIDQRAMFMPITRYAATAPAGANIPEIMRKAFRRSLGVPLGPVHIDVSREVLMEDASVEPRKPASYRPMNHPSCSETDIDAAFEILKQAERPVILTGVELSEEGANAELIQFAERLGVPVITTEDHPDAFPTTHPNSLGALGRSSWVPVFSVVDQADAILVIGGRLDTATTQMSFDVIPKDAAIIYNTKNANEIGNYFPVAQSALGSVSSFIKGMSERAEETNLSKAWLDIANVRERSEAWRLSKQDPDASPVYVSSIVLATREILDEHAIVCQDAGNATKHARAHWDTYHPRTFFVSDEWGSVGCAFPMAIGAKLAAPDEQVVAMVGDMGMACNISELETCIREKINVVTVVFNDHGLGNEKAFQDERHGSRYFGDDYSKTDFAAIAEAFGAHGERVANTDEFGPALERSLAAGKPAVIDVQIDPENLAPVVLKKS